MAERTSLGGWQGRTEKPRTAEEMQEAGVRNEPSLQDRPSQGCAEEAGPYRQCSWRRVTDPLW